MTSVSTRLFSQQAIASFTQNQARLADVQRQIASGQVADSNDDLAGQNSTLKSFETNLERITTYNRSIARVEARVGTIDRLLTQLIDLGNKLRSDLALRNTPAGSSLDLREVSRVSLESISQLLNTEVDGTFLFAGNNNAPPVGENVTTSPNFSSSDPNSFALNANYYQGNSANLSVRIGNTQDVTYSFPANDQAFQQLIGAYHLAAEFDLTENPDTFQLAGQQIEAAIDNLINLRTANSSDAATLETAKEANALAEIDLREAIGNIAEADLLELSIQSSLLETGLQATFQVFSRISQLSLVNELR